MARLEVMGVTAEAEEGTCLLDLIRRMNLPLASSCGGRGRCGKCKVEVVSSHPHLPPPSLEERRILGPLLSQGYRLACRVALRGEVRAAIPLESRMGGEVILTHGLTAPVKGRLRPPLRKIHGTPWELLESGGRMGGGPHIQDLEVLRKLAQRAALGKTEAVMLLRDDALLVDLVEDPEEPLYGVAFDVGTTTVVAYLLDLSTGRTCAVRSALNPQSGWGADVISRLAHCQRNPDGLEQLRRAVVQCLNRLLHEAVRDAQTSAERVYEVVLVGNSAMHHLFLGLDPATLAMAPYRPVVRDALSLGAVGLGLETAPQARVFLPPLKAGFVGSDVVAGIVSSGIHRSRRIRAYMDLGTNGEIVLGNRDRLMCCSTAAGPAFEGGHIQWGVRAVPGAIERVEIHPRTLEVRVRTVQDRPAVGICGSGLVSVVAEMLRHGLLERAGGIANEAFPRVRRGEEGWELVLVRSNENPSGRDIVLTQKDVAELQMAKAALQAGARLLSRALGGIRPEEILLAGAFGNTVDPQDARTVGLFPEDWAKAPVRAVGNCAGSGACLALVDRLRREEMRRVAQGLHYQELAGREEFRDLFVSSLFFEGKIAQDCLP